MKIPRGLLTTLVAFGLASSGALAATTFGSLPTEFGGDGIPNQNVTITTITEVGGQTIVLGLSATQRYSNNPAVTNTGLDGNDVGTYYAIAGGDTYSGANSNSNYGRWNVSYFAGFSGTNSGYNLSLLYEKDPSQGDIPTSSASYINLKTEDSLNLGMNTKIFGFLPAVFPGAFDPNAHGEYSFALVLKKGGQEVGRSSINVNVGSGIAPAAPVPDAGSSLALLGLSLSAMIGIKRKLK